MKDKRMTFEQAVKNDQTMKPEWKREWLRICRIERYQRKQARHNVNLAKRALQSAQDKAKELAR